MLDVHITNYSIILVMINATFQKSLENIHRKSVNKFILLALLM